MTDNSIQNETLSPAEGTAQPEQNEASVTSEAPTSLDALHPKQELRGKVKRIELFGAFVDVGVGKDGLLHISQLGDQPVKNVNDLLKEGDEITVWVRKVDTAKGMFDLTMIKPLGLDWSEIQNGQTYMGTVVRVEKFGAFIDIGAERPGMVHVSELSTGYISSPEEKVKVGDSIQVKVIKVNSRKKQIDLSVKALEQATVAAARAEVEEDDDKVPTALELALRRAMAGSEETFPELARAIQNIDANKDGRSNKGKQSKKDKRSGGDKRRQQQEEILSRTLGSREPARDRSSAN